MPTQSGIMMYTQHTDTSKIWRGPGCGASQCAAKQDATLRGGVGTIIEPHSTLLSVFFICRWQCVSAQAKAIERQSGRELLLSTFPHIKIKLLKFKKVRIHTAFKFDWIWKVKFILSLTQWTLDFNHQVSNVMFWDGTA